MHPKQNHTNKAHTILNRLNHNFRCLYHHEKECKLILTALFAGGHVLAMDYPGSELGTISYIIGNSLCPNQHLITPEDNSFFHIYCTDHQNQHAIVLPPHKIDSHEKRQNQYLPAGIYFLENFRDMSPDLTSAVVSSILNQKKQTEIYQRSPDNLFIIASLNRDVYRNSIPLDDCLLEQFMIKVDIHRPKGEDLFRAFEFYNKINPEPLEKILKDEFCSAQIEISENIHVPPSIITKMGDLHQVMRNNTCMRKDGHPAVHAFRDLKKAAQSYAFLSGNDTVDWDGHIKSLAPFVLGHRCRFIPPNTKAGKFFRECFAELDLKYLKNDQRVHAKHDARKDIKTIRDAWGVYNGLRRNIMKIIFGRDNDGNGRTWVNTIEIILTALFADGHILLEDFPGSGKSYLSQTLGESIINEQENDVADIETYRRIQCTPDLFPSDITGYMILEEGRMVFRRGPVFSYILLVDEINRTTPKVQSALLEAMAEKQVSTDDKIYRLEDLFFVIATQNPLDRKGTFELPHAQLDRFMFKRLLAPLDNGSIKKIMGSCSSDNNQSDGIEGMKPSMQLEKVSVSDILRSRHIILNHVRIVQEKKKKDIRDVLLNIRDAFTRRCTGDLTEKEQWQRLKMGSQPSARALKCFVKALKVRAFVRCFESGAMDLDKHCTPCVEPEDIRILACDAFRHRVVPVHDLDPEKVDQLINQAVNEGIENYIQSKK